MQLIIPQPSENPLQLAQRCDALYICPKLNGKRTGPLVVYAGKGEEGLNLVGDIYFNFAKIEENPIAAFRFAKIAAQKLEEQGLLESFDTVCGIPEGSRTFGQFLAYLTCKRFVYATKVPKPTEEGRKQEYSWDLSRFTFDEGERVALAEDVYNNYQNTDTTLAEISAFGAVVVMLVGALNRSPVYDTAYTPQTGVYAGNSLPVIASIREAYPEYEQSDPEVAQDIRAGNLELYVKRNWARLRAFMKA